MTKHPRSMRRGLTYRRQPAWESRRRASPKLKRLAPERYSGRFNLAIPRPAQRLVGRRRLDSGALEIHATSTVVVRQQPSSLPAQFRAFIVAQGLYCGKDLSLARSRRAVDHSVEYEAPDTGIWISHEFQDSIPNGVVVGPEMAWAQLSHRGPPRGGIWVTRPKEKSVDLR